VHRLGLRRIGGRAHGGVDAARLQERADAVEPGLAVDVLVVVGRAIELLERLAGPLGPVAQEAVEHLLPRLGVDLRGLGEHTVEVEQAGRYSIRQIEHVAVLPADVSLEDFV